MPWKEKREESGRKKERRAFLCEGTGRDGRGNPVSEEAPWTCRKNILPSQKRRSLYSGWERTRPAKGERRVHRARELLLRKSSSSINEKIGSKRFTAVNEKQNSLSLLRRTENEKVFELPDQEGRCPSLTLRMSWLLFCPGTFSGGRGGEEKIAL